VGFSYILSPSIAADHISKPVLQHFKKCSNFLRAKSFAVGRNVINHIVVFSRKE